MTDSTPIPSPSEPAADHSGPAPKDRRRLPPPGVAFPKTIKSYVKRAGRTTSGQAKAMEELGPRFLLPFTPGAIDLVAAFAHSPDSVTRKEGKLRPFILEIGFGMGEATAHIAALGPEKNFLCC